MVIQVLKFQTRILIAFVMNILATVMKKCRKLFEFAGFVL